MGKKQNTKFHFMKTVQIPIIRYKDNELAAVNDVLAVEEPLEISLLYEKEGVFHQKNISITMRTPGNDIHLALGFLFTEGILSSFSQIDNTHQISENQIIIKIKKGFSLDLSNIERHFYTSSSCGVCGKSSIEAIQTLKDGYISYYGLKISKEIILTLNEQVRKAQIIFESTGGLHASALFSASGNFIHLAEDVGRHNALDKLIGNFFSQNELPLTKHILFLSGRASFELIQKAAMAEIPIICALGAPSSLAVKLAGETNTTLIGFVKANSFNIYTGAERII